MKKLRFFFLMGVLAVLLGLASGPAQSAEGGAGVYAMGYQSSMAAFLPPPGIYGRLDYYWYQGNARILPLSGRLEANLRGRYMAGILGLTYVSPLQLLDANYAAGIIWAPIANNFIKGTAESGKFSGLSREGDYTGVGDLILTPLILGWHTEYFHFIGLFNTYAPVGSYNTSRILNTGLSRWAVEPNVGVTFLHPKYGQEVSVFMGYTVNFENPSTHYTTGNEFHLEYFIGQHLPKGFALGLAGFYYQQVTGDTGSGAKLGPFKGTSVGLGPCLTYNTQIAGNPIGINVRYYNEVYTKNRLDGQSLFVTLTGGFPKK
jgi:hypothetical protein